MLDNFRRHFVPLTQDEEYFCDLMSAVAFDFMQQRGTEGDRAAASYFKDTIKVQKYMLKIAKSTFSKETKAYMKEVIPYIVKGLKETPQLSGVRLQCVSNVGLYLYELAYEYGMTFFITGHEVELVTYDKQQAIRTLEPAFIQALKTVADVAYIKTNNRRVAGARR